MCRGGWNRIGESVWDAGVGSGLSGWTWVGGRRLVRRGRCGRGTSGLCGAGWGTVSRRRDGWAWDGESGRVRIGVARRTGRSGAAWVVGSGLGRLEMASRAWGGVVSRDVSGRTRSARCVGAGSAGTVGPGQGRLEWGSRSGGAWVGWSVQVRNGQQCRAWDGKTWTAMAWAVGLAGSGVGRSVGLGLARFGESLLEAGQWPRGPANPPPNP